MSAITEQLDNRTNQLFVGFCGVALIAVGACFCPLGSFETLPGELLLLSSLLWVVYDSTKPKSIKMEAVICLISSLILATLAQSLNYYLSLPVYIPLALGILSALHLCRGCALIYKK